MWASVALVQTLIVQWVDGSGNLPQISRSSPVRHSSQVSQRQNKLSQVSQLTIPASLHPAWLSDVISFPIDRKMWRRCSVVLAAAAYWRASLLSWRQWSLTSRSGLKIEAGCGWTKGMEYCGIWNHMESSPWILWYIVLSYYRSIYIYIILYIYNTIYIHINLIISCHFGCQVIGVEAIDSAAMTESLRAKEIVTLPSVPRPS